MAKQEKRYLDFAIGTVVIVCLVAVIYLVYTANKNSDSSTTQQIDCTTTGRYDDIEYCDDKDYRQEYEDQLQSEYEDYLNSDR